MKTWKLLLFMCITGVYWQTLGGCSLLRSPTTRFIVDVVNDQCVVIRKHSDDPYTEKGCATVEELTPLYNVVAGAQRAAAARQAPGASASAAPLPSAPVSP